jgi:hypothetical protein
MKTDYQNYVLKPELEGGGNNFYGTDIKLLICIIILLR